jgi:hypothetical protein
MRLLYLCCPRSSISSSDILQSPRLPPASKCLRQVFASRRPRPMSASGARVFKQASPSSLHPSPELCIPAALRKTKKSSSNPN